MRRVVLPLILAGLLLQACHDRRTPYLQPGAREPASAPAKAPPDGGKGIF